MEADRLLGYGNPNGYDRQRRIPGSQNEGRSTGRQGSQAGPGKKRMVVIRVAGRRA